MWLNCDWILLLYLIFCNQNVLVFLNPLVGESVRQVRQGEFREVVVIKVINDSNPEPERNHACTGTLVSKKDVLTVEHCVTKLELNRTEVIVGSHDVRTGSKRFPLWWKTYAQWSAGKRRRFEHNDIAVIRLRNQIPEGVPFALLYNGSNPSLFGLIVQAAGWGRTNDNNLPRFMHKVNLKVILPSNCEDRIENLAKRRMPMPDRVLCTIGEPTYALLNRGDSGSSIFYNGTIAGISLSVCPDMNPLLHPRKVNLHLGVDYYREYILDVINSR